jgi:PEP-CTERM motif
MRTRIASLTILCLVLAAIPASAQNWTYDNGPINGSVDAWDINFGYTVSDSYVAGGTSVTGFAFGAHEFPGDMVTSVDWILSTGPCSNSKSGCGTILGSGTASGSNLTDKFLSNNQFGFDIDLITVSNLNVPETSGTEYWLTLENAMVPSGDPVYWDENSGIGCMSKGCPSTAYESFVGTIASEAFTITGGGGSTPEPGSFFLFGSGILGLAGVLRRKLL